MAAELATRSEAPSSRFACALARFDAENACDPNTIEWEGERIPYELFYAQRLTAWVLRLEPGASEALLLAARSQHLCRWKIPRSQYEMTRAGYLQWRAELKRFHAEKSGEILAGCGYDEETVARVRALNLKQGLGSDAETQTLEDALCLVTLQYQLGELIPKMAPEKLIEVLRKTWRKMSPAGREAALKIPYSAEERALVEAALAA